MKMLKTVGLAAALTLAAPAYAVTVDGVTWDPSSALDFSSFSIAIHQDIDAATGEVSGYGFISTINGTDQSVFCPNCELTFQYGGFTPIGGTLLPTGGSVIDYSGGWVNLYADNTPEITNPADFTTLTATNTGDGALFLTLAGHEIGGISLTGTASATFPASNAQLSGIGQLDVTGGDAADKFDTDQMVDGSDLTFSNSFTFISSPTSADGTGNFRGDSIPAPAPLALIGGGLLLMGLVRSRRKHA